MPMVYFCEGWYSAEYSSFILEDVAHNYKNPLYGYSGDNGDTMRVTDSTIWYNNGMNFSTYDYENDQSFFTACASSHKGGWWYNDCADANFNGEYGVFYYWCPVSTGPTMYLTMSRMMIKNVA